MRRVHRADVAELDDGVAAREDRRVAAREDRPMERRWERFAGLGGIVAVALWLIGIAILEGAGLPDEDDPAAILRFYQDDSNAILAGGFIFELGALFFLVFLAALLAKLWWMEGGTGFLSIIVFAGGLGTALSAMGIPAPDMAGALREEDLTPEAAQALSTLDNVFFILAELCAALFVAAVGVHTLRLRGLRYRALASWVGWISLLLALWLLIPPIGWAGLIFGLPLWTLLVSVMLWLPWPFPPGPSHASKFVGTEPPPP
jgi:hypothetical protein